jgi:DNA-binding response OmpR family regulator
VANSSVARRIALVEDDADIAYTIRLNLRKHGWQVDHFISGLRAIEAIEEKPYDLVILDLNLPDIDGLAVARELRQHDDTKKVSILMLTARVEERDKLLGFDVGADDYLTKPFSMKELVARVTAHLRRVASFDETDGDVFETDGLRIDRPRFEVSVNGQPVRLTKKEFDLLWYLVKNRTRVVTRDAILARLWDHGADVETRTVDVHIRSLRRKLGERWIDTVVGVGYRFLERPEEK